MLNPFLSRPTCEWHRGFAGPCLHRQPQWSSLHALLPSVVLEPLRASLPSSVLNIMQDIREQTQWKYTTELDKAKSQVSQVLDID